MGKCSPAERERRMRFARQRVAQAWTTEKTKHLEMDSQLAEAFAEILVEEMYAAHSGCATTGQLLAELSARVDLEYKTLPDC